MYLMHGYKIGFADLLSSFSRDLAKLPYWNLGPSTRAAVASLEPAKGSCPMATGVLVQSKLLSLETEALSSRSSSAEPLLTSPGSSASLSVTVRLCDGALPLAP